MSIIIIMMIVTHDPVNDPSQSSPGELAAAEWHTGMS